MPATAVVGMFWGDEGKGKIIDYLAKDADLVARYNGGDNAGHTVYVGDQKFALHLLPSGVVRGKKIAIGARVVVNPDSLKEEIRYIESKG
jgi:adenylosuccinate synthase